MLDSGAGLGETVMVSRVLRACFEPPVDLLLLLRVRKSRIRKMKSCTSLESAGLGRAERHLRLGLKEPAKLLHHHLLGLERARRVSGSGTGAGEAGSAPGLGSWVGSALAEPQS